MSAIPPGFEMLTRTSPFHELVGPLYEKRDGDLVQTFGRPDIYAARGTFQLRVQSMEHAGRGLILQQLEALKAKLQAEGLFDESRKRPLPFLPRRVGVITGAGAAAQGDFLRNVYERFPPVKLVMCETLVQGERAAPMIVAALRKMQKIEDAVQPLVKSGEVISTFSVSGFGSNTSSGFITLTLAPWEKRVRSQQAMGGGDLKMLGMVGAFLGWKGVVVTFLLSFLIGGFVAAFIFAQFISVGGFFLHLEWGYAIAFLFFIAMMFWKPRGLFARRD